MRRGTVVLLVWLIIGAAAAGQRGYYGLSHFGCTQTATTMITILAGPLNYIGLDPTIACTSLKPSS